MVYASVGITAGTSSLDVPAAASLDPVLFDGLHLRPEVRANLLNTVQDYLGYYYLGVDDWLNVWIAGSGASYRWHAAVGLKDLDVLLGVRAANFRQMNPKFNQMGDTEIAQHLNEQMRAELWPSTARWMGDYEVTWYVNPGAWDIRSINPYAAYDLNRDEWTVPPSPREPNIAPEWEQAAYRHHNAAQVAVERYTQSLDAISAATNPAHRVNAERMFQHAVGQAVNLLDVVHHNRRNAFSRTGAGYDDYHNYIWQAGKKSGWIPALREIKDYHEAASQEAYTQTYGVELPDTNTLIRRAALHNR